MLGQAPMFMKNCVPRKRRKMRSRTDSALMDVYLASDFLLFIERFSTEIESQGFPILLSVLWTLAQSFISDSLIHRDDWTIGTNSLSRSQKSLARVNVFHRSERMKRIATDAENGWTEKRVILRTFASLQSPVDWCGLEILVCHVIWVDCGARFDGESRAEWRRFDDQRKKANFKESCLHNIKHQAAEAVSAIKRQR